MVTSLSECFTNFPYVHRKDSGSAPAGGRAQAAYRVRAERAPSPTPVTPRLVSAPVEKAGPDEHVTLASKGLEVSLSL